MWSSNDNEMGPTVSGRLKRNMGVRSDRNVGDVRKRNWRLKSEFRPKRKGKRLIILATVAIKIEEGDSIRE